MDPKLVELCRKTNKLKHNLEKKRWGFLFVCLFVLVRMTEKVWLISLCSCLLSVSKVVSLMEIFSKNSEIFNKYCIISIERLFSIFLSIHSGKLEKKSCYDKFVTTFPQTLTELSLCYRFLDLHLASQSTITEIHYCVLKNIYFFLGSCAAQLLQEVQTDAR